MSNTENTNVTTKIIKNRSFDFNSSKASKLRY